MNTKGRRKPTVSMYSLGLLENTGLFLWSHIHECTSIEVSTPPRTWVLFTQENHTNVTRAELEDSKVFPTCC